MVVSNLLRISASLLSLIHIYLKTGVQKHEKNEVVLNKSYQELAEHYGTAILPARVRAPKDNAAVEGTVGIDVYKRQPVRCHLP